MGYPTSIGWGIPPILLILEIASVAAVTFSKAMKSRMRGVPPDHRKMERTFSFPTNQTSRTGSMPRWKRLLDILCVLVALPLLMPVAFALALFIKCVSKGPSLFLQERVGYRGGRFICFKFRTMKVNADQESHKRYLRALMRSNQPMVKMDQIGDPRLIRFGEFLRATGLDELPQLLNVLGGQMSLVGPRPCLPYEFENYSLSERRRFDTWPGLTGLWQVSGKNETTFSEMAVLDVAYSRKKSLSLDLWILLKTIPAVVAQVRATKGKPKTGPVRSAECLNDRTLASQSSLGS
jgi:exopolysaccharide production protein ExoY